MNYKELQLRICEYEKEKKFDQHITPINYQNAIKVDGNFDYLGKSKPFLKFLQRNFIVKPFSFYKNNFVNKVRVYGRENLKDLDKAIVTCNHTDIFDCLAIKKALKGKKVKITAGDFNNQKGFFGEMMRVGGLMPLGSNIDGMRNFNEALSYFLKNNHFVVFYPEQAMWSGYEKPRPLKVGAFHYAVKENVPILPIFITYRHTKRKTKEGKPIKYMDVHILTKINSNCEDKKEKIEDLKAKNEYAWQCCYESFKNE